MNFLSQDPDKQKLFPVERKQKEASQAIRMNINDVFIGDSKANLIIKN